MRRRVWKLPAACLTQLAALCPMCKQVCSGSAASAAAIGHASGPGSATCGGFPDLPPFALRLAVPASRQAAIYDLDSPLAAAVPLFVAGSEWPRDGKAEAAGGQPATGQALQDGAQPPPAPDQPAAADGAAGEEGAPGGEPAGHPPVKQQQEQRGEQQDGQQHSAPGEAAGSVYLGFLQPQDVDRAHLHSLLLLARSLAPVAGPAAERCVYAAQVSWLAGVWREHHSRDPLHGPAVEA